jgi:hypothetical protein
MKIPDFSMLFKLLFSQLPGRVPWRSAAANHFSFQKLEQQTNPTAKKRN